MKFPIIYKAVELPAYNGNLLRAILGLRIIEKKIDSLESDMMLIKMEAAPCNPSDIAFMQGGYAVKKILPCVPGFEGSGFVFAVGEGLKAKNWVGKRVACFAQSDGDGTWAEYVKVSSRQVILVEEELSVEQAASFFINPFTAMGLIEIAIQNKSKGILINAAGSMLAKYMFALAKNHEINVLAVVRKQQTADSLKNKGCLNVLVSTEEDFELQLKSEIDRLQITTALDAVGGEMTGMIANCLPKGGSVIVYGGLSGKAVGGINPLQLIFNKLTISGFDLNSWMKNTDIQRFNEVKQVLVDLMLSNELPQNQAVTTDINNVVQGLKTYLGAMSEGKMLIQF